MNEYRKKVEIRWSDLDPNFHLRHSVYYDWGAFVRMSFLNEQGLTASLMEEYHTGPILFREEAVFKREIRFEDTIEITLTITKARRDMARWTMAHEIWKNGDTLCALITIDGAWLDTAKRKITLPPALFAEKFGNLPKAENFEWLEK